MSELVYVKWLCETGLDEVDLVGGKNASLGEMIRNLSTVCDIPDGFVVTAHGYDAFMEYNNLKQKISDILERTDPDNLAQLIASGQEIRDLIMLGTMPLDLDSRIRKDYQTMGADVDVAIRSSGTAEDLPDASFAGQQDTYLAVVGCDSVVDHIKRCFASLYTDRAISYRNTMGFDKSVKLSVCIQRMVRSDVGCSGVAFSIHPDSGFRNVVCINGSFGLGEMIVGGQIKPDEFIVFKPTLGAIYKPIINRTLGDKAAKMIYNTVNSVERTKIVPCSQEEKDTFCLTESQVLQIAQWVVEIETYYTKKYGRWCPVDVEWAVDGNTQKLYIVQARPETIHSRKSNVCEFTEYKLDADAHKSAIQLCKGISVGQAIASGRVRHVKSVNSEEGAAFCEGDVLVTEYTDPTFEPLMKKAAAIVTDMGGRTSHAAIVSRELGKTVIVGSGNATAVLKEDQLITICCSLGNVGYVFDGELPYTTSTTNLKDLPSLNNKTTQVMLNVGNPDNVFKYSEFPVAGVGLAREEFIIANYIGIHPNAILRFNEVSKSVQDEITSRAVGFASIRDWYVERLAHGIALISATFYPRPVIVRFSDFKTNEYRDLLGGEFFEANEENPMLGFRGCSRYYSPEFKNAFALECEAIKVVREKMGLTNTIVMLPFCRTVRECTLTLDTMREFGLERGKHGLQVYLMCEIPSNVILADIFCKYVDGFSIGSNDLTQLCLGLDRDSGTLSHIGNETDDAVKILISFAIKACKRNGVKIGICGQGPSDIPEFAEFLIREGIDSISLIPDSIKDFLITFSK